MSETKKVGIIWIVAFIAIVGVGLFIDSGLSRSAHAEVPFDHSNCQYPERLSNPVDGCDNSDPARPECMKFGTEDCSTPMDNPPVAPTVSDYETPEYKELLNRVGK